MHRADLSPRPYSRVLQNKVQAGRSVTALALTRVSQSNEDVQLFPKCTIRKNAARSHSVISLRIASNASLASKSGDWFLHLNILDRLFCDQGPIQVLRLLPLWFWPLVRAHSQDPNYRGRVSLTGQTRNRQCRLPVISPQRLKEFRGAFGASAKFRGQIRP